MHVYVGWVCLTAGCGDEIVFQYVGEEPIRHGHRVNFPTVILVKCRKCGQTWDYSKVPPRNFLRDTPPKPNPKAN